MTWRPYLLATALSFGCLTVVMPAMAATLAPESDWAVTRVAAKDPRSAPYCALARKFQSNIIMTIARNTRDETSVAIDFQQPLFTKGQDVNLQLGAGRSFLVPPASNKAVVARIGADRSFFDELSRDNGLDVSIMGQNYFFQLPEMATANAQLSTCILAMAGAAPTSPVEQSSVDNKIAALQDQISTLKTQRTSMAESHDKQSYSNQLLAAAGGGENADIAQKIALLEEQNMALRTRVDLEKNNYDNLQTKSLEDKSRLVLLEETQDQLRRAQEDTQKFRSQLTDTQSKQDLLISKLEKYSDAEMKRRQLEAHLDAMQQEHAQLVADLQAEKDRMELVQAAQEAVLNQQQVELSKTKEELEKTAQELTVKNVALSETSLQLTEAAQQRDNFKARLQEFSGIRDKLSAIANEQKNLGATVEDLKNEKSELNAKLSAERDRLAKIQDRKNELEAQVDTGKAERSKLEKLLAEEKEKQAIVADLESDLIDLQSKQKDLATRVDILQDEKHSLQSRVNELENRVHEAEAAREKAKKDLSVVTAEKEKIASDLDAVKTDKQKIEDSLSLAREEKQKIEADLQSARQEKEKIASDLSAAKNANVEIEQNLNLTKEEKQKIEADLQKAKQEKEKIASDLSAAKNAKVEIEQNLNLTKEEKAKIEADLQKATEAEIMASRKLKATETKHLALSEVLGEAEALVTDQSLRIDGMTIKQKGLLSQVASLEGEKNQLLAQIDTQKTRLASLESESKKTRDYAYESDRMNEKMAELAKERDDLRLALQDLKTKNIALTEAVSGAKHADARAMFSQLQELEYQGIELNSALEFERQMNAIAPAAGDNTSLGEMKASLAALQAERDEFRRLLDLERARTAALEQQAGDPAAGNTVSEMSTRVKKLEADNANLLRELAYERSRVDGLRAASSAMPTANDNASVSQMRAEMKLLQTRTAELEGEQAKLLAQVRWLEAEKQKMNLSGSQNATNDATEKAQLRAQITALQSEKDMLTRALSAQQTAARSLPATPATPPDTRAQEAAQREIAALQSQLAQAQALISARKAEASTVMPIVQPELAPRQTSKQLSRPVIDANEPMAAMVQNVENEIAQLLRRVDMGALSALSPVSIPMQSDVQAWRWTLGALAGNAEAHPAADSASQARIIETFIGNAKSRCPGDFAVIENSRTQAARGLVVSADIACVAGANGVAAAIAFVQLGDKLVAIAHEAPTANMTEAMTARDKLVQAALK